MSGCLTLAGDDDAEDEAFLLAMLLIGRGAGDREKKRSTRALESTKLAESEYLAFVVCC